jgi:transcriptional regulator with PAS, ATPase and Fis domain
VEHLPDIQSGTSAGHPTRGRATPLREALAEVECREIRSALLRTGGNKSQAARDLGISYPNLLKKARIYGLSDGS